MKISAAKVLMALGIILMGLSLLFTEDKTPESEAES
jgi:hypothetical protein